MKSSRYIAQGAKLINEGQLDYIQFDCLDKFKDELIHCFSTRRCGSFNKKDTKENVIENYHRICNSIGVDCNSMVFSNQVHDNKLKIVVESDKGKGFCSESDIIGIDGLITNTPGVTLVTFSADCVPVFLYESNKKVAALVHSGWRSTYKGISSECIKKMTQEFGCEPEKVTVAIGPSIGKCCFEVGEDVYEQFASKYQNPSFYHQIEGGKWKINLQGIIMNELIKLNVLPENIYISNICTKCNNDLFFSYRGDKGKTGSLAAFMQIKR